MQLTSPPTNESFKSLYEQEKREKELLKLDVMKLQVQLQKLTQIVFGGKGERFVPNTGQLTLGLEAEAAAPGCNLAQAKKIEYVKTAAPKKRDLSELGVYMQYLDRVYETREPDNLPDGAIKIGEEEHEILEQTPGKTFVRVIVIPKYKIAAPPNTDKPAFIAAPTPERPLFKCVAGSSFLTHLLIDKFCDHMPLHRQQKKYERNGVSIPYNTIIDWTGRTVELVSIIGKALLQEIVQSSYIHVDETGMPVLLGKESSKARKIHDGYLWCYNDSIKKLVYFDYQPGRGQKHTINILKDFSGIIQTDGWHVYEGIAAKQSNITQICCMAHARRKFVEVMALEKDLATYALTKFNALYEIERRCKEEALSFDQITEVRQREAVSILNQLHEWMVATYKTLLPSNPIASAIGYSLERWERLCYYTKNGMLNPDNNPVERSIRPVAVGRKNYLFAGSHRGAERLAMMYSLMGTCKLNNVNPYEWLKDVLDKINSWPVNRISELLPHKWKPNCSAVAGQS